MVRALFHWLGGSQGKGGEPVTGFFEAVCQRLALEPRFADKRPPALPDLRPPIPAVQSPKATCRLLAIAPNGPTQRGAEAPGSNFTDNAFPIEFSESRGYELVAIRRKQSAKLEKPTGVQAHYLLRTLGRSTPHQLETVKQQGHYAPTATPGFRKKLNIDPRNFTFIDFGSGKGRVLLIAAGLPFKAVVGIEFSRELHEIAVQNISRFPPHLIRAGTVLPAAVEMRPRSRCLRQILCAISIIRSDLRSCRRSLRDWRRTATAAIASWLSISIPGIEKSSSRRASSRFRRNAKHPRSDYDASRRVLAAWTRSGLK
jgi:hypothetical protein